MKNIKTLLLSVFLIVSGSQTFADDYTIDSQGAHAFIQFKIKHLGYSWLAGRFGTFDGAFSYDGENIDSSSVEVNIKVASVDSNHAERDKHLRSEDFLSVGEFPDAKFVSTGFKDLGNGSAELRGDFTLRGVTKPILIDVSHIGGGQDPWGGYRMGFEGVSNIKLSDYGITYDLGPASETVELYFGIEGIRQ